jgi:hypothetical protein
MVDDSSAMRIISKRSKPVPCLKKFAAVPFKTIRGGPFELRLGARHVVTH